MAAITTAQAELLKRRSALFGRQLRQKIGNGSYLWMTNFDATTGALTTSVGSSLTGTDQDTFTLANGESDGTFILSVNTTGTDNSVTLKAPVTTQDVVLTLPDVASDTLVSKTSTDTLTNKTLTTPTLSVPVIADFTSATHDHADAAGGGALSLPSLSGTAGTSFTVYEGGATARLVLDTNSATGDYDLTLIVPNLSAAANITLPDTTATLATLGLAETLSGAKTFSGGIAASGSNNHDFSGGTGTFLTSSGANTLSGDVTVAAGKDFDAAAGASEFDWSSATGAFKTSTGAHTIGGDVTIAAGKDLVFASGAGYIQMNGATAGALKIGPFDDLSYTVTLAVADQTGAATLTIPDLGGAASSVVLTGAANSFTAAQSVLVDNATTNAVTDVLTLRHSTTSTAAAGIGVGLVFQVEDSDSASTQQASIDVALTDVGTGAATVDADIVISQNTAGTVSETLRLVAANAATTCDYMQFTANTTETDGALDALVLKFSDVTGAAGLGIGLSFQLCNDADTNEQHGSIDVVATNASDGSEESDMVFNIMTAGAVAESLRLKANSTSTTADQLIFTSNTTETDATVDIAQFKVNVAGGNGANNLGAGFSIFLENDAGASEEHASIDFVETNAANNSEETDIVFSQMTAGAVAETLRLKANSTSTTADQLILTANTTEDNAVVDILVLKGNVGTGASGFGAGISVWLTNDNDDKEEHSSIDFVTDAAVGAEDTDIVISTMLDGTVTEAMRLDASDNSLTLGADTSKVTKLRINPATTASGTLVLAAADSAGDTDTTITNASQAGARTYTIPDAGASANFLMSQGAQTVAGAQTFTAAPIIQVTDAATNSVTDVATITHLGGTPANGLGLGLSFIVENDTDGTTQVASVDIVNTEVTKASLDTDILFSQMLAGTVTETFRIDASAEEVVIGRNATDASGIAAMRIYPQTASRGSLLISATAHGSADYATTLTNSAALGAAATVTLPADTGQMCCFPATTTTSAADANIPVTHGIVAKTSGGDAEAPTVANGVPGQELFIYMSADGGGTATITPDTSTGFSTVAFADVGDAMYIKYIDDTIGWVLLGVWGTAGDPTVA